MLRYLTWMSYRLLADLVVVIHFAFIAFAVLGGLLTLRWPRVAWIHLPAVFWGATVELAGWICPLTPLEQGLRRASGQAGYAGGFIEHSLQPILYPVALGRELQLALGGFLVGVNLLIYLAVWRRRRREREWS